MDLLERVETNLRPVFTSRMFWFPADPVEVGLLGAGSCLLVAKSSPGRLVSCLLLDAFGLVSSLALAWLPLDAAGLALVHSSRRFSKIEP